MRQSRMHGSVRGALGDRCLYRDCLSPPGSCPTPSVLGYHGIKRPVNTMNTMSPTPTLIERMTAILREAAKPTRIILFGSQARGTAGADSDFDLLVVEPGLPDRVGEMVRLRRLLSPLRVSVDLLVVGEASFQDQSGIPGNWVYEAATDGRVLYESR